MSTIAGLLLLHIALIATVVDEPPPCTDDTLAAIERHIREGHPRANAMRADGDMRASGRAKDASWSDVSAMFEVKGAPVTEPWNIGRTEMGGLEAGLMTSIPPWPALLEKREARLVMRDAYHALADDMALELATDAQRLLLKDAEMRERTRLKEETANMLEALADLARARAATGQGSTADATILLARASGLRAEGRVLASERRTLRARFRALVDDDALFCRVSLFGPSGSAAEDARPDAAGVPHSVDVALFQARPMLRALDLRADAALHDEKAALWEFLPMPEVGVSYMWRPDVPGAMDHVDFLGARLVVPLPVGFEKRIAMRDESRDQARVARYEKAALIRELTAAHEAWREEELASRDEERTLVDEVLPLTQSASAATRAAYETGELSLSMIIDVETDLLMVEEQILMARIRAADARLMRARLLGLSSTVR
jgi:outer membrane protein TolC